MRSLRLPVGFTYSSFAKTLALIRSVDEIFLRFTSGLLPIVRNTPSIAVRILLHSMLMANRVHVFMSWRILILWMSQQTESAMETLTHRILKRSSLNDFDLLSNPDPTENRSRTAL